jgi:hypothetical protein
MRDRGISTSTVVAAVLALVFLGLAGTIAATFVPANRATSVYAFISAVIAPTVLTLLALVRADHNTQDIGRTAAKVDQATEYINGHLERHDQLADHVLTVAENIATLAGPAIATERKPASPESGGTHHG